MAYYYKRIYEIIEEMEMDIITEMYDPVSGARWSVERSEELASNALNDYLVCTHKDRRGRLCNCS